MEPVFAAASAVVALVVQSAAKNIGEESGKASWGAAKSVVERIQKRFRGDREAEDSLRDIEGMPKKPEVQDSLQRLLVAYMLRDQKFHDELVELVERAGEASFGGASIQASVIKNANVFNDKVEIAGDWNLNNN